MITVMMEDAGPLPYFAYGSNLSVDQMAGRCPGARPLGPARLVGWCWLINLRGVATITVSPHRRVIGVLWGVTEADLATLDRYEGVAEGRYHRAEIEVEHLGGPDDGTSPSRVRALTYLDPGTEPGRPRPGYLERVLAGAHDHDLGSDVIAELERWGVA